MQCILRIHKYTNFYSTLTNTPQKTKHQKHNRKALFFESFYTYLTMFYYFCTLMLTHVITEKSKK